MSRSLAISAVAGIVALVGSSAAFAAGSFDVTAGSAPAGTVVGWSATTVGALPQVTFRNTTGGTVYNCASASAPGTMTVGTDRSGTGIGTVNGAGTGWNTCTASFGIVYTHTGIGSWRLDATGDTVGGVTPVRISGVNLHVAMSSCSFDYTGSIDGTYTNGPSNGTLTLPGTNPTLTVSGVIGSFCSAINIANGHAVSLKTTYEISATNPAYDPIHIDGTI